MNTFVIGHQDARGIQDNPAVTRLLRSYVALPVNFPLYQYIEFGWGRFYRKATEEPESDPLWGIASQLERQNGMNGMKDGGIV